ncbi:MAG: hypothetical protein ACPGLV_12305, partial [Bacteroidia bacterium]
VPFHSDYFREVRDGANTELYASFGCELNFLWYKIGESFKFLNNSYFASRKKTDVNENKRYT